MTLPAFLFQDTVWVDKQGDRHLLAAMNPDHRSNLIPFLRGNARTLYWLAQGGPACTRCNGVGEIEIFYGDDGVAPETDLVECATCDGRGFVLPDATTAEDWLELTPLMHRLVEFERGRSIDQRRATHERNIAHERATGYQKVRLG